MTINVHDPLWLEVVKELTRERDRLREELEALLPQDASLRDTSDFTRGRIFELNNLINRKNPS